MLKLFVSAALILLASVATANTDKPVVSVHILPVIVKSDLIKPGVCRLYFEQGNTKDVPCIQNVADDRSHS